MSEAMEETTNFDFGLSQLFGMDTQTLFIPGGDDSNLVTVTELPNDFFTDHFDDAEEKENICQVSTGTNIYKSGNPDITSGRFAAPLTEKEIENKKKSTVPKNTTQSNSWACTVWKDWARNKNLQFMTAMEPGFPIPEDIGNFENLSNMDFWLQRYICEIRRRDGQPYPPDTLTQITAGLQRYLRNERKIYVNFFSKEDKIFAGFRQALDSQMRQLTNLEIGIEKKQAAAVTVTDEKQMWETKVFSMELPVVLVMRFFTIMAKCLVYAEEKNTFVYLPNSLTLNLMRLIKDSL